MWVVKYRSLCISERLTSRRTGKGAREELINVLGAEERIRDSVSRLFQASDGVGVRRPRLEHETSGP